MGPQMPGCLMFLVCMSGRARDSMPRLVRAILNPNETCAVEVQRRSTGLHATYGLGKSEHANDRFSIVASGGGNPQAAARQFAELGCQILARVDFPGDVSGVH